MADPQMVDLRPLVAAEMSARANQLATILEIPADSFPGREAEAYQVMGNLAAMPAIAAHDRRRQYGIEILTNAAKAFPP